jgi:predicted O-methyltransferase YrrM
MTNFDKDPFANIQAETLQHRKQHGCGAYSFEDGPALIRLANEQQPSRVLELGTALGYTACCLAHGSPNAHVDTIEGDSYHIRLARKQIAQHGLSSLISVHHGDFDIVLTGLQPGYEMAFFDGFAPPLDTILCMRKLLVTGGLLICANLHLGTGHEAQLLAAEFTDPSHWEQKDPIEDGGTAVLMKRVSHNNSQD